MRDERLHQEINNFNVIYEHDQEEMNDLSKMDDLDLSALKEDLNKKVSFSAYQTRPKNYTMGHKASIQN